MSNVNQKQAKVVKETTTHSKPVIAKPKITKTASKISTAKKIAPKVKKVAKPAKEKTPKLKMVRDRFTMPENEYAHLSALKERLIKLGHTAKKSELIRAGILHLTAMTDATLKVAVSKVPVTKTGKTIN
jgi:hypothetical protein